MYTNVLIEFENVYLNEVTGFEILRTAWRGREERGERRRRGHLQERTSQNDDNDMSYGTQEG